MNLKNFFLIFFILTFLILSAGYVCAENNLTAADDSSVNEVKIFDELQEKINNAEKNDVIELNGTYTYSGKTINFDKSVTLDGQKKTIIDGNNSDKSLFLTKSNQKIVFKNLKFTNANNCIIDANGGNLIIENCEFITNHAKTNSIISIKSNTNVEIHENLFEENTVLGNCGIIYIDWGNVNITDSVFKKNSAGDGGVIFSNYQEGNVLIDNITYENNFAGIKFDYSSSGLITNSRFNNNKHDYLILFGTGNDVIDNCEFRNNVIKENLLTFNNKLSLSNSIFENNNAVVGIRSDYGNELILINSNFTGNKMGIVHISRGKSVIDSININENNLQEDGIYSACKSNVIKNSNFTGNTIKEGYLAVRLLGDASDILNCDFINNNGDLIVAYSNILNCRFIATASYVSVVSIQSNKYIMPVIKNSIFKNNKVIKKTSQGSTLFVGGTVDVISCDFSNNTSPYRAGAIFWLSNGKLDGCSFADNHAKIGGALYISDNKLTFTKNQFSGNTADSYKDVFGYFSMDISKTSYYYGEKITVKLKDLFTKKDISNMKFSFTLWKNKIDKGKEIVGSGKSFNTLSAGTGNYWAVVYLDESSDLICGLTKKITIKKAPTIIKAPKVTNKFKKSKYFKITVKSKVTKNPVKKTKLKVKIDKRTYNIRTDKKGVAKINTKNLKIGKHKVVISSGNANYKISAKSQIKIKR